MTVRALPGYADVAPQTALTVATDLAEAGLVSAQRAGRARLVSMNRSHILAQPLVDLVQTRVRFIEELKTELAGWNDLAGAWLFGSAARGAGAGCGTRLGPASVAVEAVQLICAFVWANYVGARAATRVDPRERGVGTRRVQRRLQLRALFRLDHRYARPRNAPFR
ncbi:MAG: hypothetical protein ACRDNS_20950 [Trebonia sp.]